MTHAYDPGPVELHARNVEFEWQNTSLHWIPDHPVPSNVISMLNLLLPEGERWFVQTYNEALPLVKDEVLAAAMRGFIGQEAMHAEAHDRVLWEFLDHNGLDPRPFQSQMEWLFRKILGPSDKASATARYKHLVERLWLIAAIEHYTAVLGDFALNNSWDEYGADPMMADLFRWHGAEEVEHRCVAHDVATHFGDSYLKRGRAMLVVLPALLFVIHRGIRFIAHGDPAGTVSYPRLWLGWFAGARKGLLPTLRSIVLATFSYFRRDFSPMEVGSTAQAVAYLATSPAARSAHP
jgi:predicted metal-dependent hydrolase